ncbi:drug/metabolite exporter YedA [Crenobacter caeni]|uniref:Drug/metabolite exporter YedA n=1 Tax=Crenobacter caeni TaxID=2705474 RepID=A0A6B2KUI1_9NEIS|nr:drug/metabolite exporter YedA [Crenobacter caeni]NDV13627.1 drug/metabolite exporter YedA [Crenobacter caeni]
MPATAPNRLLLLFCFFCLYVIWGSTYFAIRIGVEYWPPFMMAGVRFFCAGLILMAVLLVTRQWSLPSAAELKGAAILGVLMPGVGNGLVTLAEKDVSSGVAALVVATVPLFATLFAQLLFRQKARSLEWAGIALGFAGMVFLNMGANLQASPTGAVLLLAASAGWALGSAWSRHLAQPKGIAGSAWMMVFGGASLLLASLAKGETLTALPPLPGWLAVGYLVVFGSIVAYSAYLYLLKNVSAAAATSYAYVNPIIAVLLGVAFLGEHVGAHELTAMAVIVTAVVLISWKKG